MRIVSQFWRDLAAGKPLSRAWACKDAQIALERLEFDAVPMRFWMRLEPHEQRQLLRKAMRAERAHAP